MVIEHLIDPYGTLSRSIGIPVKESFVMSPILTPGKINVYYTLFDRMVAGGAWVQTDHLELSPSIHFGTTHFLSRRELVIYCLSPTGIVTVGETSFNLSQGDALYLGIQNHNPVFSSKLSESARFYFVSTPAHRKTQNVHITKTHVTPTTTGSIEALSLRDIYKMVIHPLVDVCQLQSGITQLRQHQLFNTLPPHTHSRRSEIYFYFNLSGVNQVEHYMGPPDLIESVLLNNNSAILVPPGHVHYGKGSSEYTFIWAMGGENLTYDDMDPITVFPL
jgi:4-deoxy-L-threo-5-hexosulose-uronate ketol-isomerase